MCHQGCHEKMLTIFQDRGDISGQSTRLSTTNTALRAVKEAEERDELHVDFTRQYGKSSVTTSAVLHCVWQRRRDRGAK